LSDQSELEAQVALDPTAVLLADSEDALMPPEERERCAAHLRKKGDQQQTEAEAAIRNLLIQSRDTKVARILAHKGEHVHVVNSLRTPHGASESYWPGTPYIDDCNQDFITLGNGPNSTDRQTFPMSQIDIGVHYQNNQFKVTIHR
jgi:hypothetical protein